MPILYPEDEPPRVVLTGHCAPEEADALLEWLRQAPEPVADLSECGEIHSAVVQLLLASGVRLLCQPADPILASCFGHQTLGGPDRAVDTVPARTWELKHRQPHAACALPIPQAEVLT